MGQPYLEISGRKIGSDFTPLVIAEIGINHEGDISKALRMVDDAHGAGAECVKIQTHIIEDEMIPNDVVPGNAEVSIWEIMKRCALTRDDELAIKKRVEDYGMIFLSTPFSRAAADRLNQIGITAFKIGSGECNNYPLIEHIASFGKPIILSTGMNNLPSIKKAVEIFERFSISYALLHCTSIYPTPYEKVRLGALEELGKSFPGAVLGLSDHSMTIYPCLGAVSLGASILERHFTSDKSWPGPDIEISMDPVELKNLVEGSRAIFLARGGHKEILQEEQVTIDFAYASVVTIRAVKRGETLSKENIWVKRPGTGEIRALHFKDIMGKTSLRDIATNEQLSWSDFE